MKKYLVTFIMCSLIGSTALFALTGQVVTITGKVEYQDTTGVWKSMKAGDSLQAGTMISSGFKSEATIKLGASILTIKPLTRMTLTQLVEKEDTVTTELYLEVGNIKAEVNSTNNKKNGFSVKSPVATASVRGTVFEFGEELKILEGSVAYVSALGQTRIGSAGQQLEVVAEALPSPANALKEQMQTIKVSSIPSTEVRSPVLATITAPAPVAPVVSAAIPVTITQPTSVVLVLQ